MNAESIEHHTGAAVCKNPRLIHRVYCPSFKPFYDPYMRYLESWEREMPSYEIVHWNEETIDFSANEWLQKCYNAKSPVYISEYARWWALKKFGGLYLDADCEILDGKILDNIVSELYAQDEYDVVFGIEAKENGYPTAQTVAAKPNSGLARYMCDLYENRLSPLFAWRDSHALIGPRLMGLYMLEQGINQETDGFFVGLEEPKVVNRMKVYPQTYFSPKFSLLGETLDYQEGKTCVYHMFGNANIDFSQRSLHRHEQARQDVLTFEEYQETLIRQNEFPREYHASHFRSQVGSYEDDAIESTGKRGVLAFGPYVTLPKGEYTCRFKFDSANVETISHLSVTKNTGRDTLAKATGKIRQQEPVLTFSLSEDAKEIEFIVECKEHRQEIKFKGVEIDVRSDEDNTQNLLQLREKRRYLRRIFKKLGGKTSRL